MFPSASGSSCMSSSLNPSTCHKCQLPRMSTRQRMSTWCLPRSCRQGNKFPPKFLHRYSMQTIPQIRSWKILRNSTLKSIPEGLEGIHLSNVLYNDLVVLRPCRWIVAGGPGIRISILAVGTEIELPSDPQDHSIRQSIRRQIISKCRPGRIVGSWNGISW